MHAINPDLHRERGLATYASRTALADFTSWPVITADRDMTLAQVAELFRRHDIHHLPVVDDDMRPVGVVSSTDLGRITTWRAFFQPARHARQREGLLQSLLVRDILTDRPVVTLTEADTVADAARLINERRFHCVPVTTSDGVIAGIVTAHDLLRAAYG